MATLGDEQLLEAVSLEAKSSIPMAQLSSVKYIDIMRRVTAPHIVGDAIEALYVSPIVNWHSVAGLFFLRWSRGECLMLIFLLSFLGLQGCGLLTPSLSYYLFFLSHYLFLPRSGAQGTVVTAIQVIGFE